VRFSIVEVPLPPGASLETTTWGINLPGEGGKPTALERSRAEPTRFGYAVPVDGVTGRSDIRNLVRFAQAGTFAIPRARLYRMYQPTAKAIESGEAVRRMEVR
jgi:uncharacterized protein YfaS (alpha-2-macroglobulin family)